MTSVLLTAFLMLTALAGTAVVLTRNPLEQTVPLSFLGLLLAGSFFLLRAPDVALSEIAVGGIIVPAMTLLTLAKLREYEEVERRRRMDAEKRKDEVSA